MNLVSFWYFLKLVSCLCLGMNKLSLKLLEKQGEAIQQQDIMWRNRRGMDLFLCPQF